MEAGTRLALDINPLGFANLNRFLAWPVTFIL